MRSQVCNQSPTHPLAHPQSKHCFQRRIVRGSLATDVPCLVQDGGELIECDYPGCAKVYHSGCVGLDPKVRVAPICLPPSLPLSISEGEAEGWG